MEESNETAWEHFLDKNHAKMLAHLQRHFDSSDCWKNATPETVQFKLRLGSKMDVEGLTKCGCEAVIFTLKAMKYKQTPFFQGLLWALPPTGFTQETWKDMCGSRWKSAAFVITLDYQLMESMTMIFPPSLTQ